MARLGFFAPLTKRSHASVTRRLSPTGEAGEIRICGDVAFGLPTTADLDRYLVFLQIVNGFIRTGTSERAVLSPVTFTSYEMIRFLGNLIRSGKNYASVANWLYRMSSTTIESRGEAFFLAREHSGSSGVFRLFDRVLAAGCPRPDGRPADRNYVWLSNWYVENLDAGHFVTLPVAPYRRLTRGISKALAPLLLAHQEEEPRQVEFDYEELCQRLNITPYRYASKMKEKMAPALDELRRAGFLERWRLAFSAGSGRFLIRLAGAPPAVTAVATGRGEVEGLLP